jgi:hypothetical protein
MREIADKIRYLFGASGNVGSSNNPMQLDLHTLVPTKWPINLCRSWRVAGMHQTPTVLYRETAQLQPEHLPASPNNWDIDDCWRSLSTSWIRGTSNLSGPSTSSGKDNNHRKYSLVFFLPCLSSSEVRSAPLSL